MITKNDHTFVICAYQESPYLEECIKSVCNQTVTTNVVIVTSTENNHIRELSKKYGIELLIKKGEPGIASDWNFALSVAKTPLVTIAHQDDVYESRYAEELLLMECRLDRLLIYFTNYDEIRGNKQVESNTLLNVKRVLLSPLRNGRFQSSRIVRRRILSLGSAICCPSVTVNKNNIPLPLFQKGMGSNLDWQAWERLSKYTGSFYYNDSILMHHRIHEGSETTRLINDKTRGSEDLAMFELFWPKPIAIIINKAYSLSEKSNR